MLTLDQHLSTLAALRDKAAEAGQLGAAITAEVARGKAAGLYVEKREVHARMTAVVEVGDDKY